MKMLWNDVTWRDGYLRGRMPGDIGIEDAGRRTYFVSFSLKLRGDVLNGAAPPFRCPAGAPAMHFHNGSSLRSNELTPRRRDATLSDL